MATSLPFERHLGCMELMGCMGCIGFMGGFVGFIGGTRDQSAARRRAPGIHGIHGSRGIHGIHRWIHRTRRVGEAETPLLRACAQAPMREAPPMAPQAVTSAAQPLGRHHGHRQGRRFEYKCTHVTQCAWPT